MSGWRDISTAPNDGRDILVWDNAQFIAAWFDRWNYDHRHPEAKETGGWIIGGGRVVKPTLWQPLPDDPY